MANLTRLFQNCIYIIEENNDNKSAKPIVGHSNDEKMEQYALKDSFMKECRDLLKLLVELRKILKSIEPQYLSDTDMSEKEKDDFDTELRLQFHQYAQKFRLLKDYEEKRQALVSQKFLSGSKSVGNLFHGTSKIEKMAFLHKANSDFRAGVLQSLSMWLNMVSNQFTSMQQERLISQRKFDNLDFNSGLHSPSAVNELGSISSVSQSHIVESTQEEVKRYEDTISKLTQEQLQLLEDEHKELLNQKNEQLKKVEKINKTIMDVVAIQSEISANLQIQSQNINNILDHQDDIEINIKEGNKQLTKAKRAAGRTAKMTTYTAVILGLFILFLDYVG